MPINHHSLKTPKQNRRLGLLALFLVLGFAGLGYRLVDLQVLRHEELRLKAQENTERAFFMEPRRGDIRDIKGNVLATSRVVKTVCADPTLICNTQVGNLQLDVARTLGPMLQMSVAELMKLLPIHMITNAQHEWGPDRYVVLKRKVAVEDWDRIRQAMKRLTFNEEKGKLSRNRRPHFNNLRQRAIFAEDDQLRDYPNRSLSAHVLGYVGMVERQTNRGKRIEMAGQDGMEYSWNAVLGGVPGWRQTEIDERRHELVAYRFQDVPARSGWNVVLTLDLGLQFIVESALAEAMRQFTPISASAMVIRPRTGEVLAMATLPNYDPNSPGASPPDSRRNRIITDLAEPGSTFKIVVVTAALNERVVGLHELIDCENGKFSFGGAVLHEHDRRGYGLLTVENVITKSSNIGAAKVGIRLGPEALYRYIRGFGFGERTGIPLPGERVGTVHPLKKWRKISISRIPMGHEVAVSPLQITMAMCAIANGGRLMRPKLVDHLVDDQGRVVARYEPELIRRVCGEEAARQMVTALKSVVATNGTALKARLDNYTVAGKTGTAQKANANGYLPGKFFSSFLGFFPADSPELVIAVFLDEPRQQAYYGGQTAAPIFKNIAERAANYLNIRPEFLPGETLARTPLASPLAASRSN